MSHALFTLRQDRSGEVDRELSQLNLARKIVLTTPYFLVLPTIVASTELVAAVPSRMASYLQSRGMVEWFELPIPTEPWMISMIWSKRVDQDPAHQWLRQQIQACFQSLQTSAGSLDPSG